MEIRGKVEETEVTIQKLEPNREKAEELWLISIGGKEGDMIHVHLDENGHVFPEVVLATDFDEEPVGEREHLYLEPSEE